MVRAIRPSLYSKVCSVKFYLPILTFEIVPRQVGHEMTLYEGGFGWTLSVDAARVVSAVARGLFKATISALL